MDTHRISYFLCVAEEGSINRAASVLGVAQPALSRQLRLLERNLGVSLFRRSARGVQLTQEGEQLRATAAVPLRQLELALRYLGSPLARLERGLRLGLPTTAAGVLARPVLDRLSTTFPKVELQVRVASSEELIAHMLKRTVDVALIEPTPDERIFRQAVVEEDLVVVSGPAADLPSGRSVTFAELAKRPLILPAARLGLRNTLERTALRLKLKLRVDVTTDSLQVTKDLLESGRGSAVLPFSACISELQNKRLHAVALRDPSLVQQLGIAVADTLELPRGFATRVTQIIRKEVRGLVKSNAWGARVLQSGPRTTVAG